HDGSGGILGEGRPGRGQGVEVAGGDLARGEVHGNAVAVGQAHDDVLSVDLEEGDPDSAAVVQLHLDRVALAGAELGHPLEGEDDAVGQLLVPDHAAAVGRQVGEEEGDLAPV